MKVKFEKRSFSVGFIDKIFINIVKLFLFIKRQLRRLIMIFPKRSIVLLLIVVLFWCAFVAVVYFVGKKYYMPNEVFSLKDVIWDIKNSFFTSFIITFVINTINEIQSYKKRVSYQYDLYIDSLHDFDNLFAVFIGNKIWHFMPFYCDKTLNDTLTYLKYKNFPNFNSNTLNDNLSIISKRLDDIKFLYQKKGLLYYDGYFLVEQIEEVQNKIEHIRNGRYYNEDIVDMALNLLDIIDAIRIPWRKDVEYKIKILKILDNYEENEIKEHFYYSMLLCGFDFNKPTERITKIRICKVGKNKQKYDQLVGSHRD